MRVGAGLVLGRGKPPCRCLAARWSGAPPCNRHRLGRLHYVMDADASPLPLGSMLFNWGHTWEHSGDRGRAELAYHAVIRYLPCHVRAHSALAPERGLTHARPDLPLINATGVRVRDLPIMLEKVLPGLPTVDV